ncbi:hypothetical protein VNO77_42029 [Canavalia gladiata]|uniref:Uncharacterized protein n=1 Tax=Canavalia gladiata TaxID=3824 RepID=A0AAN9K3D2_CANGL
MKGRAVGVYAAFPAPFSSRASLIKWPQALHHQAFPAHCVLGIYSYPYLESWTELKHLLKGVSNVQTRKNSGDDKKGN